MLTPPPPPPPAGPSIDAWVEIDDTNPFLARPTRRRRSTARFLATRCLGAAAGVAVGWVAVAHIGAGDQIVQTAAPTFVAPAVSAPTLTAPVTVGAAVPPPVTSATLMSAELDLSARTAGSPQLAGGLPVVTAECSFMMPSGAIAEQEMVDVFGTPITANGWSVEDPSFVIAAGAATFPGAAADATRLQSAFDGLIGGLARDSGATVTSDEESVADGIATRSATITSAGAVQHLQGFAHGTTIVWFIVLVDPSNDVVPPAFTETVLSFRFLGI